MNEPTPGLVEHIGNMLQVNLRGGRGPVFEVFQDQGDHLWRFREKAGGNVASTAGQPYRGGGSKSHAKRAAYAHAKRTEGATVRVLPPVA